MYGKGMGIHAGSGRRKQFVLTNFPWMDFAGYADSFPLCPFSLSPSFLKLVITWVSNLEDTEPVLFNHGFTRMNTDWERNFNRGKQRKHKTLTLRFVILGFVACSRLV
jgi:hypothetical protein